MTLVADYVLDNGLAAAKSAATDININTAEQSTYSGATSGATFLGKKTFGAGSVFPAAITAGSPNGRKIVTAAVTDGAISTSGSAAAWSSTDNANSRLLFANPLSASQTVTSGNPFTLNQIDCRLPGA